MKKKASNRNIVSTARIIADAISDTDTDERGILLSHVATMLSDMSQNYTASLIYRVAIEYGISKELSDGKP